MSKRLACHYSVVRFCPYPETDEFVNVGVLLACPALGYLDGMRADLRRRGRVGRFFPELDPNIYSACVLAWDSLVANHRQRPRDGQMLTPVDQQNLREQFLALVRPRESILFYGEPRAILSEDPQATLNELFGAYVERRFAHAVEYQERVMCRRLERVLDDAKLLPQFLRDERVGDDLYHVRFPFVKRSEGVVRPRQAIKALHLDRETTTELTRHADEWVGIVRRLRRNHTEPEDLLFVLQGPLDRGSAHRAAFDDVRRELDAEQIPHVPVDAQSDILGFAGKTY
jgi:hypothetical protein